LTHVRLIDRDRFGEDRFSHASTATLALPRHAPSPEGRSAGSLSNRRARNERVIGSYGGIG
jgi:hypothetical protein